MAEKLTEVYDKYDIELIGTRRGRGSTILTTTEGLYILEPFRGSVNRLEQEYVLKRLFEKEGFCDLDQLIPNQENELITYDRYHQPFVLKHHFSGEECDMHNLSDVVRAVEKLAQFHLAGQSVVTAFDQEWEQEKTKKEQIQFEEIKQALAAGEELEQVARIYGMTPAGLREFVREMERGIHEGIRRELEEELKEEQAEEGRSLSDTKDISELSETESAKRMLHTFVRRNRELRKIRRFVGGVKRKNSFELLFMQIFEAFYQKGVQCERTYENVMEQQGDAGQGFASHYGICHGNYNQHNVILDDNRVAIVHLEKFTRGNQLDDLYQFTRKVMEKNHFDYEMLEMILDSYGTCIPLNKEDYRYMYVLFSYPEKFWKIANGYYNTNKAFLSPKYEEKLKMVVEQEKEKNEMLMQYSSFHLN